MTPQPDKEYIITEEQAQRLELCHRDIATNGGVNDAWCIMNEIRSRPAPSPEIQVISVEPHPYAKELKAIENYIYSSMNHTDEWNAAEQAYQNILSRPAPAPSTNLTENDGRGYR